ncbi:MAG TPA: SusD/RagB family nutrient-binding outer membrane lipoprotein, partial [Bacteroidetes bacterium]|nr:SusD/RagB family nutrient-binding outer membrane lipoprotein [Bacteroidota bacterium]
MKNILKYLSIVAMLAVSSCALTELDYLDNPNGVSPENAESRFVFYAIQLDLENFYSSVNWSASRPVRMLPMTGGNIYNNAFSALTFNGAWNLAYSNLFPDMDALIAVTETEGSEFPALAGATKVMKAYVMMTLVDLFGDVPYSEAGQGVVNKSPKADPQQSVYDAALALLDEAVKDLGTPGPEIDSGDDLFYGGDVDKWLALANTMKLKWYITTRLVASPTAEINALVDHVIQDADGDFQFNFGTNRLNPDARHPFYINHYEAGSGVYLSNYYMWSLKSEKGDVEDPRLRYYFYRQDAHPELADAFTLGCLTNPRPLHYTGPYPFCVELNGGYWGRDHGDNSGIPPDGDRRTVFGLYPGGGKFDNGEGEAEIAAVKNQGADGAKGQGIAPIMLSSFVKFMLAEASLTLGTTGDAKTYLEQGIRESIAKVMSFGDLDPDVNPDLVPTQDDIDAYVAHVMDAYDNAGNDDEKLDIIMKEYHIALWGNGMEAYN